VKLWVDNTQEKDSLVIFLGVEAGLGQFFQEELTDFVPYLANSRFYPVLNVKSLK
jgi:hypothetical protein